jgi:mannan endo-1,4-beta-mannosidase
MFGSSLLALLLILSGTFAWRARAATSPSAATSPPAATASPVPPGFVYRQGHTLMLDGAPYRFAGFDAFGMAGCATGTPWTAEQLDAYFGQLPPAGMTRTWAFAQWGVAPLDQIVASAQAHGQKLIFSLAEAGSGCDQSTKDTAWYRSGYRTDYLAWVRTVVTRYRDSPAIGMWEIINEPGHLSTVDEPTLKAFLDDSAATIKSIDPQHLVESGATAEYAPGNADFGLLHSGPDIDVGSLHEYDESLVISHHLAPTLSALYAQNKPLIVGEVGITSGPACPTTPGARATALKQKFDAYFLSGVAGIEVWNYTPNPGTDCGYSVRGTPPDPAIAVVAGYRMPAPVVPIASHGRLIARHSGKCLDVTGASTANHALLQQYSCGTGANQQFQFQPTDGGFYRIVAQHSGRCLDVSGQSLQLKALIQQYDCWDGSNQQFRFAPTDGGYYQLVARGSTMCLDVAGHSTADAAGIQQYDCGTGTNQQFRVG